MWNILCSSLWPVLLVLSLPCWEEPVPILLTLALYILISTDEFSSSVSSSPGSVNSPRSLSLSPCWSKAFTQVHLSCPHYVGSSNLSNVLSHRLQTHAEQWQDTALSQVLSPNKHLILSPQIQSSETFSCYDPFIGEWAGACWTCLCNFPPAAPSRSQCKAWFSPSYFQHSGWSLRMQKLKDQISRKV